MSLSMAPSEPITLLHTKLYPPQPGHELIARPQLIERLNRGLRRKLTLVTAPAGYGKTTLVSAWLAQLAEEQVSRDDFSPAPPPPCPPAQPAWLSLDDYDNDLGFFLRYLVAAVQTVFPEACANTLSLLAAPQLPPLPYLATSLINDLAALPTDLILVLDDYHCLELEAIHQLVSRLLDHLPRPLHLVLLSRTEPPLPLPRLRVSGQVSEIRAADLAFSEAEAQTFLTHRLGRAPAPETVAALQERTEGWAAGLQLAALSLQGTTDEGAFVHSFRGSNHYVLDYLLEEVLAQQPQAIQDFLLQTSILDRLCAPLCQAVLSSGEGFPVGQFPVSPLRGRSNSSTGELKTDKLKTELAYLARANLFITSLDEEGRWYRYHHLFQELLRRVLAARLSPAEVAGLHRRAGAWLADQGFVEEALRHALAAGDTLAAAQWVEGRRHELLDREAWPTLERWLALLPEALVRQRPALLMAKAMVLMFQFNWPAIPPLLEAATARLNEEADLAEAEARSLGGEIDLLWSHSWYWQNEGRRSLASAQQALERLPEAQRYVRGGAMFYLGLAYHLTGRPTTAIQTLRAALAPHLAYPDAVSTRLLLGLALIYYSSGDLTRLQQTGQVLWRAARGAKLSLSIGWAHYFLGLVCYEWNELDAAARHFSTLVEGRYSSHTLAAHNGWLGLAWTYQAQGRFEQARQQLEALLQFHREMDTLAFLPATQSFQARLALQQGDLKSALRWAQAANLDPAPPPFVFFEVPQLSRAKVLLAQGTAASLAEATQGLAQLRQLAEATHRTMRLIEILALQALAAQRQGGVEPALAALERAVALAKPGRFMRTFVDLGPPMAELLYQLAERGFEPDYIGQVLAAFPADPAQPLRPPAQANLVEPLTERELEVLALLAARLSNKEIAQALTISPLTVRTHTHNLYQKLGVKSRKQAVAKARGLGLLPS